MSDEKTLPPFHDEMGPAPSGVCGRVVGTSPCGAMATHHVIWDVGGVNAAACAAHAQEARDSWAHAGLHPYTADCAAAGHADWLPDQDRCVRRAAS